MHFFVLFETATKLPSTNFINFDNFHVCISVRCSLLLKSKLSGDS